MACLFGISAELGYNNSIPNQGEKGNGRNRKRRRNAEKAYRTGTRSAEKVRDVFAGASRRYIRSGGACG